MEIAFEKCGIVLNPPAFVAIYRSEERLRKKVMPLRNFKHFSNVEFVANDLRKRHHLDGIPLVKIEKLLRHRQTYPEPEILAKEIFESIVYRLLQERLNGLDETEALEKIEKEYAIKVNEDLNKLSTHDLELQKKLMNSLFLKNQIKKEDEDFVYDKEVDFAGEKENSNWDVDSDNFWD